MASDSSVRLADGAAYFGHAAVLGNRGEGEGAEREEHQQDDGDGEEGNQDQRRRSPGVPRAPRHGHRSLGKSADQLSAVYLAVETREDYRKRHFVSSDKLDEVGNRQKQNRDIFRQK